MEYTLDQAKSEILCFLEEADGRAFDISNSLFSMICKVDPTQQPELFQYSCEMFRTVKSNKRTRVPVSEYSAQKDSLEEQYGDIVNSLIKTYCQPNGEETTFYQSLWKVINESFLFDGDAKKIFALYYILIDKRIPYFKIDDNLFYSMSDEHFAELTAKTIRDRLKIRFIIKTEIAQKTERAAILLNELGITMPKTDSQEDIEDYEKRIMQMVYILQENLPEDFAAILSKLKQ